MSAPIATFYVQQYATNVALLVQQKENRLARGVMIGSHKGKAASPVEQVGSVAAVKRTVRYDPVNFGNTPTDRPWVYPADYDWYDAIDNMDKLRMLIDPQSSYVMNGVAAMNRAKDDEIISAFFAARNTGETGQTSTVFLAGNQINVDTGGTTSGLNVAKLRAAKKKLLAADIDEDEEIFCAVSAIQHDNLLNEIQVISSDFNGKEAPVLQEGKVTRFLGINFIHSERLPVNGSSQRRIPVWCKSGMHLGIWNEINTDVTRRNDLRGKPIQVSVEGTFGATRLEEKKIVELPCAES